MKEQLDLEEQVRLIQLILHDNDRYPDVIKKHPAPYLPLKKEEDGTE